MKNTVTESLEEQLSAFVDGELPAGECELLSRRVAADGELKTQIECFTLIGQAIRGELQNTGDVRERLRAALDEEQSYSASQASSANRKFRIAGGFAVAASVALVAILGLQYSLDETAPDTVATTVDAPQFATQISVDPTQPSYTTPDGEPTNALAPNTRLVNYMLWHGQQSRNFGPVSSSGVILQRTDSALDFVPVETPDPATDEETDVQK